MVDDEDENPNYHHAEPYQHKIFNHHMELLLKKNHGYFICEEDFFMIHLDKADNDKNRLMKKLIEIYTNYINDEELNVDIPTDGKVKPDSKMGYVS